ncbi:MAG TPA: HAMP domain-containing sensor histidine kinase [Anaerovoracaceae bacterium]|nr:HAMP domain-containing sensor histidine kinase [Anaerovoracaceae bacterium]
MDIKLKSFSRNRAVERAAFFLCVVLFLSSLIGGAFIYNKADITNYGGGIDDLLLYESYEKSTEFQREFESKLYNILSLLDEYKSEENIKSGKTIDDQRLDHALRNMFYNGDSEYTTAAPYVRYGGEYDDPAVREQFLRDYSSQIDELKKTMIIDDLRGFEEFQKQLNKTEGFSYYATDGTNTVMNINITEKVKLLSALEADFFKKMPAYLVYEGDDLTKVPVSFDGMNDSVKYLDESLELRLDGYYNPDLKVYFSFDKTFLNEKEAEFAQARAEIVKWIPLTLICGLLSLVLLIYLLITTGRKDEEGNAVVYKVDRIFTELQLFIIGVLFVGGGFMFGSLMLETVNYGVYYNGSVYVNNDPLYLSLALALLVGLFSAGFGLYFILSVVRNIKSGRFLKNSVIYLVLSALWKGLKTFYFGGSLMKKVVLITLAICILSATVLLAPVAAALVIIFAPKWVKKFEDVKKGVEEVKNGNLSYKIKADGDGELDVLARGINEISEASNIAIQNELKNQRLKTDLISNVSHDLKTPLTSIITYIDLLKQEGLDCPDAPKYLEILDQKSIRLKKLTEDLFDAAKASSGAIPVRFEKVDMLSLINQGLGEMSDRIETSNLEFKVNAQNDKYYVRADGQLLWRVVENLLGNVLKYAQEGSRVYIDLKEQNGKAGTTPNVILEIKNISKTELNIDADELMERFKRGDESRTTEGSGLGLAIAKDLVRLQNGWFEIKIDGDLFKAVVMLEANNVGQSEKDDEHF